jgi:hypothetical protein
MEPALGGERCSIRCSTTNRSEETRVIHARLISLSLALLLTAMAPLAARAQSGGIADVSGPGQAVAQPPAQCPRTVACQYSERNFIPSGYRLQSLEVCGANCTTQYWVAAADSGQQLL